MATLEQLAQLAKLLVTTEKNEKACLKTHKDAQAQVRKLREEEIPSIMLELGVKRLDLDTGQVLTVTQEVFASIPAANKTEAFAWLEDNKFGDLIKSEVKVNFGRGELTNAEALISSLVDQGLEPVFAESVHASTLKSFLKEQIAAGNSNLDLDLFGARPVSIAKIK